MSSVLAAEKGRTALASLAPLFAWPDAAFETRIAEAAECIDAHAAQSLRHFAQQMSDRPRAQEEITYTASIDLAPPCSPYLGVELFGEDSQHRARLMYGIQSVIATRYSVAPPP
ncbi:MAG TPA: hypothetical protein VLU46_06600, partial [Thermoanaerobaculia bacterium]|nr:hypothetical protein [Thermoanaerobaculia bacterium]